MRAIRMLKAIAAQSVLATLGIVLPQQAKILASEQHWHPN